MEKIILISKNKQEIESLKHNPVLGQYELFPIDETEKLGELLSRTNSFCVILDIDSIQVDNRTIRKLTIQYPQVYFLCMSIDRFHPDLKDAICYHIYACLTKPLDEDELLYWLKCIEDEEKGTFKDQ